MDRAFDLVMSVLRPQFDAMPITDDDYLGEDGMITCANCKTPKQRMIELLGEECKVKVLCVCQEAELDRQEREDKLRKQKERMARWRMEGIENTAWQACRFEQDDGRDPSAAQRAKAYADNFDKMYEADAGLLLVGGIGSGKTFLAACVAGKLSDEGRLVVMTSLSRLISHMNADYGHDRDDWLDKIARAHLLVIDDFGVERTTEYSLEQSYEIINARYKSGKPMIVTTNLPVVQLQQEQNLALRRIYDRVIEKCIPLMVHGDSRRQAIASNKRREAMKVLNI